MKKYRVTVIVHLDGSRQERKVVTIEAGTKKIAHLRAMRQVNLDGYSQYFKTIESIEEI